MSCMQGQDIAQSGRALKGSPLYVKKLARGEDMLSWLLRRTYVGYILPTGNET